MAAAGLKRLLSIKSRADFITLLKDVNVVLNKPCSHYLKIVFFMYGIALEKLGINQSVTGH